VRNVTIYIYDGGNGIDPAEAVMIDSNGGVGIYRKRLIGCDSSYAALTRGNYVAYDPGGTDDINAHIFNISADNVTMENFSAANPAGSGTPANTESCFVTSANETVFRNCRAVNGYEGFSLVDYASILIDCVAYDCRTQQVNCAQLGCSVLGGYFEKDRAKSYGGTYPVIRFAGGGKKITDAIIVGGTSGIDCVAAGSHLVLGCTFYNQTASGVIVNHAEAHALVYNSIFLLADAANDAVFTATLGGYTEDYNITNATAANARFIGEHSVSGLALSATSPFVNCAKNTDNYKYDRDDALIANVFEAGWAPYLFTGTIVGAQSIGAFGSYDLPAKSNVLAADTVYGETGTAAAGGAGFPVTSTIGGHIQH
jgi:hypothetical protein